MNHKNLALVSPEPATSKLHQIGSEIRLGDIFTLNSAQELATARRASANVFGDARDIAYANKGTTVVFAGTFPDGKNRVQATLSVPPGQSVKEHREKLAAAFKTSVSDVLSNHFTKMDENENGDKT